MPIQRLLATVAGLIVLSAPLPSLAGEPSAPTPRAIQSAGAADVTVSDGPEQGEIVNGTLDGRPFSLAIPKAWNGEAVLMAHGYSAPGSSVAVAKDPLAQDPTLGLFPHAYAQGYAVGHSAYDKAGVGVETGATNTLRLKHLLDRMGARRVYVVGGSMGGNIVMALIEGHPREFGGALTLCGVDNRWSDEIGWLINLRATYNYFAKGTPYALPGDQDLAVSALPIIPPAGADGDTWRITQMLRIAGPVVALFKAAGANPNGPEAALIARVADLGDTQPEPGSFIVPLMTVALGMDDMSATMGGVAAGNVGKVYQSARLSEAETAALNRDIQRVATGPKAAAYSAKWHDASGRFVTPLVTVHNRIDPLVPYAQSLALGAAVAKAGNEARLIQFTTPAVSKPLPRAGLDGLVHCGFTPAETTAAWDVLRAWVETGRRPKTTELPTP